MGERPVDEALVAQVTALVLAELRKKGLAEAAENAAVAPSEASMNPQAGITLPPDCWKTLGCVSPARCPIRLDAIGPYSEDFRRVGSALTRIKRTVLIRLNDGDDLITVVKQVCLREGIRSGLVFALGAMTQATYAVYDPSLQAYQNLSVQGQFEFTSVVGNVCSLVDDAGQPVDLFVHVHINFSDSTGKVYGGHLQAGSMKAIALGEVVVLETDTQFYRYASEVAGRGYSPVRYEVPAGLSRRAGCGLEELARTAESRQVVVSKEDLLAAISINKEVKLPPRALLTPLARLEAERLGIKVIAGRDRPADPAGR